MAAIPHVIIDDFLPDALHRGLLEHVLAVGDSTPGKVQVRADYGHAPDSRRAFHSDDRLGPFLAPFRAAVQHRFDDLPDGLKMPPFDRSGFESLLVAHGDGDFTGRTGTF